MKQELKDKVIIITGASSGIGKALCIAAADAGAKVLLAARNRDAIRQISEELNRQGADTQYCQTDVAIEEDCKRMIEFCVESYGRIDILINNAGISMRALFHEVKLDVIHQVLNVNFWGTVYCTHYALPWLLQSGGSVVGVSSIAGYKGLPGRTAYSASKFALQGFLEVLRIENLYTGLHVLTACPGFTASNIRKTALNKEGLAQGESPRNENKMMTAELVAQRILHAIERRKNHLLLSSQGKLTVFLNKFFPGFMDRMVYHHMAKEPDAPFGVPGSNPGWK